MHSNFFLLSSTLQPERLSWIAESIKFFFVQLYPEMASPQKTTASPVFTFFITGDALYSLANPETVQIWDLILSFSPVRIICDRQELDLRGIGIDPMKRKYPDQVIDTNTPGADGKPSFWRDLAAGTRQTKAPLPGTAGWFQTGSPYMHRSAWQGIQFLFAAQEERLSTELHAYLDGVHIGHLGQHPDNAENIGNALTSLNTKAIAAGLTFHATGCSRSAAARGYSTWDDGQGQVISTCTERAFKIRDLSLMINRFKEPHPIFAPDAGIIRIGKPGPGPTPDRADQGSTTPPVTILITTAPYGTSHAAGAISFAVACAHAGILTRVIFLEDGIYALTGNHRSPSNSPSVSIPEILHIVAGNANLHFFAFTPSLQKRGIQKDRSLNAVPDIGYPGLGKILFFPPGSIGAEHQRVYLF